VLKAVDLLLPLLEEVDVGIRCTGFYIFFNDFDTILSDGGEKDLALMASCGGIGYTLPGIFHVGPVGEALELYSKWFKIINRYVLRTYIEKRDATALERERIERIFEAFIITVALRHGDLCIAAYNKMRNEKKAA